VTVRLVHLSDIHFGDEDGPAAEAAVAFTRDFAPDLVVVTGDLTANGLPREFVAARTWLDRLPAPLVVTPGNHDTPYWNIPLRALAPFDRYRRYIGPPDEARFDSPDLSVHAVNTARGAQPRPNWSLGAINMARVEAAARRMAASGAALNVFACHHPLIDMEGAPVHGGVHRGDAAARVLAGAGADLILTGHLHTPFASPLPYGSGHTYAAGTGTLSVRTRGVPPMFSTLEADADTIAITAQAWAGSHFEPFRTWALPRRSARPEEPGPAVLPVRELRP
jgi:3',5'-cyclic AMP phosphodiesterase CpdA